uniref:Secreted protein n=1 Tax=Rhizophora mucronata TaxID=61149 RepID=A0A2P2P669_RHIMU
MAFIDAFVALSLAGIVSCSHFMNFFINLDCCIGCVSFFQSPDAQQILFMMTYSSQVWMTKFALFVKLVL